MLWLDLFMLNVLTSRYQTNPNLLLYSRYCAKACNKFAGPCRHCARSTQLIENRRNAAAMASRWQHCVRFDRHELISKDKSVPLDQLTVPDVLFQ